MMHYSYFKEPELKESGYTKGYKTGSMNYLANGNITFVDLIKYYDGQVDSNHDKTEDNLNSTVRHQQRVNFSGEKGISEFYAKGFYPSNRAISAWKKIRYDDLDYKKSCGIVYLSGSNRVTGAQKSSQVSGSYNLGESRKSSVIIVEADAAMGPRDETGRKEGDYVFDYKANVKDGVVEIWDATGWTNRSGARRIDWEQTALMRGDWVNITDNLVSPETLYPGGPEDKNEDWLSCCIGGTTPPYSPPVEDEETGWPNTGTWNTLKPAKELPDKTSTRNCTIDSVTGELRCEEPRYEDFECTDKKCTGYGCIYEFPATKERLNKSDPATVPDEFFRDLNIIEPEIDVTKTLTKLDGDSADNFRSNPETIEHGKSVEYLIRVKYLGAENLRDLEIVDRKPDELTYENSTVSYDHEKGSESLFPEQRTTSPGNPDNIDTSPSWNITEIKPGTKVFIYVNFTANSNVSIVANKAYAGGTSGNKPVKSRVVEAFIE